MRGEPDRMPHEYRVWDAPTRLFHWATALVVFALGLTGFLFHFRDDVGLTSSESKLSLMNLHATIGYGLAIALVFRLVWAFVGNRHARWRAFWPTLGSIRRIPDELRALRDRRPVEYVGHSPISRVATTLLLSLMLMSALSGLFRAGSDLYAAPLGSLFARYVAESGVDPGSLVPGSQVGVDPERYQRVKDIKGPVGRVHYWLAWGLLATIAVHIAGVSLTEIRQRSGLVSAMFSGRKQLLVEPLDAEHASVEARRDGIA